jgi:neuropeptide FF receptor 2
MYGLIILLALIGNAVVILVVARNKRMHTPTNYFIVNLAVSDILVTSMCTWVHLVHDVTEGWVLGAFFCKINSFAQGGSAVSRRARDRFNPDLIRLGNAA